MQQRRSQLAPDPQMIGTVFFRIAILGLLLFTIESVPAGEHVFSVRADKCYLDGDEVKIIGLRCSNALLTDQTAEELVSRLPIYRSYGVNAVSVYLMGSRFGNVKGYQPDATLSPMYAARMARIIEAADRHEMIVLVGCLYWSDSAAKEDLGGWRQAAANKAVANTVQWLSTRKYRNVFVDPDNEGMAARAKNWSIAEMIDAAHAVDDSYVIGFNLRGRTPPGNADILLHHSAKVNGKPWVQSEGDAGATGTPGGYWGVYSKQGPKYKNGPKLNNYINIGIYTDAMKEGQCRQTSKDIEQFNGYMMASTWLQCVPPHGPNHKPGGDGSRERPGIKWWLEYVRDHHARAM
jgi:hypothetical protein